MKNAAPRPGHERGQPGPALNSAARIAIVRTDPQPEIFAMTQTSNRFFDEIGRLMNDAAGAAQGVKREVDTVVRNQAEKILRDLDIVKREEFEAVKDMARLAREENEALKLRIAALEAKLGASPAPWPPVED
jgi:BMFP domain-containing protein YqiC